MCPHVFMLKDLKNSMQEIFQPIGKFFAVADLTAPELRYDIMVTHHSGAHDKGEGSKPWLKRFRISNPEIWVILYFSTKTLEEMTILLYDNSRCQLFLQNVVK